MTIINNITNHYAKQDRLIIHVPEWGEENQPLEMHVLPMTMAEVNMIQRIAGKKATPMEQAINLIIIKAKDKEGKRLFNVQDKDTLMNHADYRVMSRIAEEIERHFFGSVEEAKGNSDAIHSDATS